MIGLTRKTDYALLALAHLAGCRLGEGQAVSAREVADRCQLPLPVMMNVLKELARARLVASVRGAAGGYMLAADPATITVAEVITAIEGPVSLAECCMGELPILGQPGCQIAGDCAIQSPIRRLHERLSRFLEDVTLAELTADVAESRSTNHEARMAKSEGRILEESTPLSGRR